MDEATVRVRQPVSIGSARAAIRNLAREASVEMGVQDLPLLQESRNYLPGGARVYVSHLPKQSFEDTLGACAAVSAAGFDPIPHVPVRLVESRDEIKRLVGEAVQCGVKDLLLISGDYAHPRGPFTSVADVLRAIDLRSYGLERVSFGGHPEGHSNVALGEIRRAEREKAQIARDQGLGCTFATQFFFESAPFLQWARALRSDGVSADIRAGLAGPAKITTLLRYALRCGVGPSIRALGNKPSAFTKLLGDHGPEHLLWQLADAAIEKPPTFQGIHLFCFGGYLRTCRWLRGLASGNTQLDPDGLAVVR